ncbi:nucleoside 2-deoxyribosyltransferase [Streptomyces sp. SL13]|uniref:Nucleoside 2-deoxyribosyltransferase n=1 Tax=Streptantibioticus silvisoli TaxID=2705255 RepID=A0AA90HE35_9ACTN|nr:nucleoside 2-deoxyribosyltransferase [Streptantibioticus silvisoli]MDI5974045.1 nucleoside 2-deoxyribosyltransferase [Streptantibioticus silvisoli]
MTVLAYVTAPAGTDAHRMLGQELVAALESLGVAVALAELPTASLNAAVAQGASPVDASCHFVDARAFTIAQSDLLIAVLDGADPDVLVDIGMAYASGTDCYGLHVADEVVDGLHTRMLDGQLRTIPDLLAHLRVHLRLEADAGHPSVVIADGVRRR